MHAAWWLKNTHGNREMSTATQQPSRPEKNWGSDSRASSFDKVRSLLLALLLLIGFFVTLLFLIWLTATLRFDVRVAQVQIIEQLSGR